MAYIKSIVNSFSKNGFDVSLLNTECNALSLCFVDIDGKRDTYCMLYKSTMFYYIIEGEGNFKINGENIKIGKNDLIEIPPKNKYTYDGKLKMLEVQSQAFDETEVHEEPVSDEEYNKLGE